jgi:hypothetical protein
MIQDVGLHVKLNPGLPWKSSIQQEEGSFHQQTKLKFKEKLVKCYILITVLYGAETWALRKVDQKVLKRGAGEGWRSVGPIV